MLKSSCGDILSSTVTKIQIALIHWFTLTCFHAILIAYNGIKVLLDVCHHTNLAVQWWNVIMRCSWCNCRCGRYCW